MMTEFFVTLNWVADRDLCEVDMGPKRLNQVNSFVYLGCRVTKDADHTNEVKSRLAIGWRLWWNWSKYERTNQSAAELNYD